MSNLIMKRRNAKNSKKYALEIISSLEYDITQLISSYKNALKKVGEIKNVILIQVCETNETVYRLRKVLKERIKKGILQVKEVKMLVRRLKRRYCKHTLTNKREGCRMRKEIEVIEEAMEKGIWHVKEVKKLLRCLKRLCRGQGHMITL